VPIYCSNCGSREVTTGIQEYGCLECGRLTRVDGTLVPLAEQFNPDHEEVAGE
jgi:acetone carboxylase gamma subunit